MSLVWNKDMRARLFTAWASLIAFLGKAEEEEEEEWLNRMWQVPDFPAVPAQARKDTLFSGQVAAVEDCKWCLNWNLDRFRLMRRNGKTHKIKTFTPPRSPLNFFQQVSSSWWNQKASKESWLDFLPNFVGCERPHLSFLPSKGATYKALIWEIKGLHSPRNEMHPLGRTCPSWNSLVNLISPLNWSLRWWNSI